MNFIKKKKVHYCTLKDKMNKNQNNPIYFSGM